MQENPVVPNTIVVGNSKSRAKVFLIIFTIIVFLITLGLVVVLLFSAQTDNTQEDLTPVPTAALVPSVTPSVPPTIAISPTLDASGKVKYILNDCEIEVSLEPKWISSPRGQFSTCGIFSTHDASQFTNFTNYPGTLIAIIPLDRESIFTPTQLRNKINYEEYLKSLPTEDSRFDPSRDFLYSRKDTNISKFSAIETEIYKSNLGRTNQIFYKGFQKEYVIIWGGQTSESLENDIQEVIANIEQLVVIPTED